MNRFLQTSVLALSLFACAGKDKILSIKPLESTAAEKERIAACRKTHETVKRILQDPERPWVDDLSYLADELLINCSTLESEVIDALRALLARKAKASAVTSSEVVRSTPPPAVPEPNVREIIRDIIVESKPEAESELGQTSPDFAPVQPQSIQLAPEIPCEQRLANIKKRCGVPALGEIAKACGKQKPLAKNYSGEVLKRSSLETIFHPDAIQDEWLETYCSATYGRYPYRSLMISKIKRFSSDDSGVVERWYVLDYPDESSAQLSREYDYSFVPAECRRVPKEENLGKCPRKQIKILMKDLCPPP